MGIEPILQGFSGLVPNYFATLYPNANTLNQGTFVGVIKRPILLDSGDSLYKKYSTLFYNASHKYYGKQKFYSYDLFHEGGVVGNTDMPRTVNDGLNAMQKNNPNSIWVSQAWEGQGKFPEGTPPDNDEGVDRPANGAFWGNPTGYNMKKFINEQRFSSDGTAVLGLIQE